MGIDIRLPNITASTEREQLVQMKSYLFQLAEQLQWALQNVDTSNNTVVVAPAAKSLGSSAQTPESAEASFGAIKALIIKSADIVNAYYEEINKRLEGEYVAQSDFGTYTEQTSQQISKSSTSIEQLFTNIQEIVSNIEHIEHNLIEANAHINSGILDYDSNGAPIYGLEIGQKNIIDGVEVFNKYARYTSDKLSFYDKNDTEVAYISDYKLYITNAQITGTLTLGRFVVDTSDGISIKWV